MTNATSTKSASTPTDFDRAAVSRTVALVRHELSELMNDARRVRPFFSPSREEAAARRDAAIKALNEFAQSLDAMKKA